jgi:hypothetical protein
MQKESKAMRSYRLTQLTSLVLALLVAMKSYRTLRLGSLMLAWLAMCTIYTILATAAYAEEAPFWTVKGERLAEGKTAEAAVKLASANFTFGAGGITVTCTKLEAKKGAKLIGSKAGEAGTGEAMLRYSECGIDGDGTGCKLEKAEIETVGLRFELVEDAATKKKLLLDFLPASGDIFATVKAEGNCTFKEGKVVGRDILTEAKTDPGEKTVELGGAKEEAPSWLAEVEVPQQTSFWLVKGGSGKVVEIEEPEQLMCFGVAASIEGTALMSLASGENWSPLP